MRRTLHEWIDLAREAVDPAERARCLDAAAAEAEQCWEWRSLLAALRTLEPIDRERLAHAADRALATSTPDLEVWGFNDAAFARHHHLDDPEGAAAALEAGTRAFVEQVAQPYQWGLLARGYAACGDLFGARRSIDAGIARARAIASADSLAGLASELFDRGEHDAAEALLREAEALPSARRDAWGIANAWSHLERPDEATRVLEDASIAATNVEDALRMVSAFASHQQRDAALRAYARAESLATSAKDWLEVADHGVDLSVGEARLRHALEQAAAQPASPNLRAKIAAAVHRWLGDAEAAAKIGPRGVRPRELRAPRRALPGLSGDAEALFDHLRATIERPSLETIAAADYGFDAAKNLLALEDLCASGLVPRDLDFGLHEVCALTRWSTGARVDHRARALACLILLYAASDDDGTSTTPVLIESALALGGDAPAQAIGLLAWLAETDPVYVETGEDDDVDDEDDHDVETGEDDDVDDDDDHDIDIDEDDDGDEHDAPDRDTTDEGRAREVADTDPRKQIDARRGGDDGRVADTDPGALRPPRRDDDDAEPRAADTLPPATRDDDVVVEDDVKDDVKDDADADADDDDVVDDAEDDADADVEDDADADADADAADDDDDDDDAEPVFLLGLALLVAARDPDDPALASLAGAVLEHPYASTEHLQEMIQGSIRAELWGDLIDGSLGVAADRPAIAALLRRLGRPAADAS